MYTNEQEEIRNSIELEKITKFKENDAKPTTDTEMMFWAWLLVTVIILVPALLLGGGPGWIIGIPIAVAVSLLVSGGGGVGKKLLIGGAAGYVLGKKLEL